MSNYIAILKRRVAIYWYWDTYSFYIYLKWFDNKYKFRYIPKFHRFSKDRRRFLLAKVKWER